MSKRLSMNAAVIAPVTDLTLRSSAGAIETNSFQNVTGLARPGPDSSAAATTVHFVKAIWATLDFRLRLQRGQRLPIPAANCIAALITADDTGNQSRKYSHPRTLGRHTIFVPLVIGRSVLCDASTLFLSALSPVALCLYCAITVSSSASV
jgi:hypothetical protein